MNFVSGVITSFNQEKFIKQSICSLADQVDELIVVDDASSDNSAKILSELQFQWPNLTLLKNQQNLGISESFNRGIKFASGELILIQGGDDVSLPDRRIRQEKIFDEFSHISLSFCKPIIIDQNDNEIFDSYAENSFNNPIGISSYLSVLLLQGNKVCAPSACFKKSDFVEIGLFSSNLDYTQDLEAWLKLSRVGEFHFSEIPFIQYRIHGSNTSRYIDDKDHWLNKARNYELAYILNEFIDSLSRDELVLILDRYLSNAKSIVSDAILKIQVKRFVPNYMIRYFLLNDLFKISDRTDKDSEIFNLLRDLIKSTQLNL